MSFATGVAVAEIAGAKSCIGALYITHLARSKAAARGFLSGKLLSDRRCPRGLCGSSWLGGRSGPIYISTSTDGRFSRVSDLADKQRSLFPATSWLARPAAVAASRYTRLISYTTFPIRRICPPTEPPDPLRGCKRCTARRMSAREMGRFF